MVNELFGARVRDIRGLGQAVRTLAVKDAEIYGFRLAPLFFGHRRKRYGVYFRGGSGVDVRAVFKSLNHFPVPGHMGGQAEFDL